MLIQNQHCVQPNFLGFNAVYHGYAGLNDQFGRIYNEELCELEADRAAELGLKVARTFYKWYAWDDKNKRWDWENSNNFNAFCRWVERLQKRGIEVALNAGWCSPGDILSNSWTGQSPFTVPGDWKKSVENYAAWVSESVHQLVEVRGFKNVKYLVLFTEPQNGRDCPAEAPNAYECWYQASRAVANRLAADGRRHLVKLIGPNEGSTEDPKMLDWVFKKDPDLLDIYSAHNYLYSFENNQNLPLGSERFAIGACGNYIAQDVALKPNTSYTLSCRARLTGVDRKTVCGYALFGILKKVNNSYAVYSVVNGVERAERLFSKSTTLLDPAAMTNELQPFSFSFTTKNDVKDAFLVLYAHIKPAGFELEVCDFSLKEQGKNQELLAETELSLSQNWYLWGRMHIVNGPQYFQWVNWVKKYLSYLPKNAELWFDEYNTAGFRTGCKELVEYEYPLHGTNLSIAKIAFLNCGLQSSFQWTLFDQQWPNNRRTGGSRFFDGVQKFGVMPDLLHSRVPYPAYYAQRIMGLAGGEIGTKVYPGGYEDGICSAMVQRPNGKIVIFAVNDNKTAKKINLTFETPLCGKLKRYLYNPATVEPTDPVEPLRADTEIALQNNGLCDELPAGAVVAYAQF